MDENACDDLGRLKSVLGLPRDNEARLRYNVTMRERITPAACRREWPAQFLGDLAKVVFDDSLRYFQYTIGIVALPLDVSFQL